MRVKIFSEASSRTVEAAINQWLSAQPEIKIAHVAQTQTRRDETESSPLTISIFYQEEVQREARRGFQ